jgi:hypothetical protein
LPSLLIEAKCRTHGVERYKIKIVKKHNINSSVIQPKFRTRPKYGLSRIVIGRNVPYEEAKEYLLHNLDTLGLAYLNILSIRVQK